MTIPAIPKSDINRLRDIYENTTIESECVTHIRMLLSHISDLTHQLKHCEELVKSTELHRADIKRYKPSDDALATFEALMSLHECMIRPNCYYAIDLGIFELVFEVIGSYKDEDGYFKSGHISLDINIDSTGDIVDWFFTPVGAMNDRSMIESYQGSFVHSCGFINSYKDHKKKVWKKTIEN
jgi:hypothetical protein